MKAWRRNEHGFTLVEMLVVLAVLALASAITVSGMRRTRTENSVAMQAAEVARLLTKARYEAIFKAKDVVVEIDTDLRIISGAGVEIALPRTANVSATIGRQTPGSSTSGAIVFRADGRSSGGEIAITAAGQAGRAIRIDWLT